MRPISAWNRRVTAAVLAAVLLVGAIVAAVLLSAGPQAGGPPSGVSTSASAASPTDGTSATPTTTAVPGTSAPAPPETGAPPVVIPEPPVAPPPVPTEPPVTPQPPPAAPFPQALLGQDVEVLPGAGRVVALTFDAGANSAGLPKILQGLANAGVPASFFLTGSWAAANPAGVSAIVAAGHRVGNHSMTHPGFTGLTDAGIAAEVQGAREAILAAGADPAPLFRFPFGERDARTIAAVNNLGYVPVRWTVDTLGWKGTSGGITAQIVADRVLSALRPGEIVLMHIGSNPDDGTTLDADALPQIIDRVRQAGYSFVTLDSLL
ncbi:MAG: polysaccharide deacetylase family protein [Pseudarthrobacter sp.]